MPYFNPCGLIATSCIFKMSPWMTFLSSFPSCNQFGQGLIMSSFFSMFQFTYCYLCFFIMWSFNIWFRSLYAYCLHDSTVTIQSILWFKVLLKIFGPSLQYFPFVAHCITSLFNKVCESFSYTFHFLIKFICFIVVISNFHLLQLWFKQYSLFFFFFLMCFFSFIFIFLIIFSGISVNHFLVSCPFIF
jgi:hypothetical protein